MHRVHPVHPARRGAGACAVATLGLLLVAAPAAGAPASPSPSSAPKPSVFVEATPSTAEVGRLVGIRASCRDNRAEAAVMSTVFGRVVVHPQDGFLTATATIPQDARADDYVLRLRCTDGRSATTHLHVLRSGRPNRGPATGFGGLAGSGPPTGALLAGAGAVSIAAGLWLGRRRRAVHGRAGGGSAGPAAG